MFWFNKKPCAIIVCSRQTGMEEASSVTVNAYEMSSKAIFDALKAAGDALQRRVSEYNAKAIEGIAADSKAIDPVKLTSVPKKK